VAVYHKSVKCNPLTPLDFVEQFVSTIDKILRRGIRVSCYMSVTSVAMAELTVRHYYSLPVSLGGLLGSDIRRFIYMYVQLSQPHIMHRQVTSSLFVI